MRILFIGGTGRSGSTLLERLLGELPEVCSLGEVVQLWTRVGRDDMRCGCGNTFAACDFWAAVGDRAFGGWGNVDLDRLAALWRRVGRARHAIRRTDSRLSSALQGQVTEYADYYLRLYTAAAEVTGARVVVDSSKDPGLALCLRRIEGLDLRLVHLVRDPRGVVYSWTKRVPNPEVDGGVGVRMSPLASALQWTGVNAALELLPVGGLASRGPTTRRSTTCQVRYEDLISDPAGTVRALARLTGLCVSDDDLAFLQERQVNLGIIHSAGGNRMRFTTGSMALYRDDAWRTGLPLRHRALVTILCFPLMVAYRYPPFTRSLTAGGSRADR